jgi:hypothetical protein
MRPIRWLPGLLVAAAGFVAGMAVGSIRVYGPIHSPDNVLLARSQLCVERLAEIEERLAALAASSTVTSESAVPAASADPVRVVDETPSMRRLEERLTKIEAVLERLAASSTGSARGREDPPRRAKDVAAVDRLFEAEHAKRMSKRDDHLGYTPDRLYDRYGAPDSVQLMGDTLRWTYIESLGTRGVIFYLRGGVVTNEDPFEQ